LIVPARLEITTGTVSRAREAIVSLVLATTLRMCAPSASFVVSNGNAVIVSNPTIVQGPQP
jgi:hypothetical protein